MENPADDPREFTSGDTDDFDMPAGLDTLFMTLQDLSERTNRSRSRQIPESDGSSRITFQIYGDEGHRTISLGGPDTLGRRSGQGNEGHVPTMSEYLRRDAPRGPTITGHAMAQYIMALLGNNNHIAEMLSRRLGADFFGGEGGRMGDYVFSQEALDQIITQLMESSNAHRPVPASEEVINNLQRDVLLEGSDSLEKDCAICKEQFSLKTDNPDELMVITLPCKHIFHEPCITPWLKSSGTCPVCRHALVPQPGDPSISRSNGNARPGSPSSNDYSRPRSPGGSQPGLLQTFFGGFGRPGDSSTHRRSNSDPSRGSADRNTSRFPGSWEEGLD
ncbi:hypothetical protein AX15_000679 [Amanita polypyramis BW_CC]|nr:hypothetical protein AX15_000679 [Amanita polypyramis BW_CC]